MDWCYRIVPNHWLDIVMFTFITKVLLFPLSLWGHRNSLAMVAVMPMVNDIKVRYFGDKERIDEESVRIFKENNYHPMLSLVPLAIQIIILMGFVKVIYGVAGVDPSVAGQKSVAEIPLIARIPVTHGGVAWIMPVMAGAAAWFLGWCQNRINPLQREQTRAQQMVTNGISIAISLSLGCFVGMGVGLYWVFSNLFSIIVQLACNLTLRPSKYIDYKAIGESKEKLAAMEKLGAVKISPEDKRREKEDYNKFFKVANKHIVFYSESSGFYKYFKNTIAWLLEHSNLVIHYVTNDPKDQIFEIAKAEPRIRPYFIGQIKIIPLMMKMDADMVVMTMPDLDRYQIKRSYVRNDTKYVYIPHGMASLHMTIREKAHANYDAILFCGPHQVAEARALEAYYGTRRKELPICGYGLLDDLIAGYTPKVRAPNEKPLILIAPSHQADNIMDSCLDELIATLCGKDYRLVVRPHPQYKKRYPARLEAMLERYKGRYVNELSFETDFSSNTNILDADLLICDWSGIAFEYAFTTLKPVLSINTPMKVINPNYKVIDLPVLDITLREEIGVTVDLDKVGNVADIAREMLATGGEWKNRIEKVRARTVHNIGGFGAASGKFILDTLINLKKGTRK